MDTSLEVTIPPPPKMECGHSLVRAVVIDGQFVEWKCTVCDGQHTETPTFIHVFEDWGKLSTEH